MRFSGLPAALVVVILMLSGLSFLASNSHFYGTEANSSKNEPYYIPLKQSGVVLSGVNKENAVNSTMPMNILVTLSYRNQTGLDSLLYNLQNPASPYYHKYLTPQNFISRYSPTLAEYNSYINYFRNEGMNVTATYSDRLSIAISSNAGQLERTFHTNITYFNSTNGTFYAPDCPLYLSSDFGSISGISGISDQFKAKVSPMFTGSGSGQYLYGADLQTAYQLNKLYQNGGYPTGETVATILWSGTDSGTPVGPFVPSDVSTYLLDNTPASEPKSSFYGLPVGGAPLPGPAAAYDTTGANIESTLDLEMAGSTAPGATLVEVYGPQPYLNYLDEAFAEILNPNYNATLDSALSHVVAISNSWGSNDMYDSAWSQYEQEAAARGITVLVSSGDNGNTNSVYPSFPATVGYNAYGSLAVGGTQTVLSGTQTSDGSGTTSISSESVWYNTPNSGDGSQGGVSTIYSEPSWQANSPDANAIITGSRSITGVGSGRGTPDIAAVGANMLVYLSSVPNGGTGYFSLWGTSIASPLDAGLIATIDNYMNSPEGFMNPFIYSIGQEQYQGTYTGPPPFYFIHNGSNGAFASSNGYDLVDGWGSINAYNFVLAQESTGEVTFAESGLPNGARWYVNLSDGQSLSSTTSSISALIQDGTYSYTSSVALPGYNLPNGAFTVSGNPISILVKYIYSSYSVGFTMVGLPVGSWYINVTGNSLSENFGSVYSNLGISISLPNGTYDYTVSTSYKNYAPSIYTGSFTVEGSNLLMSTIVFTPVDYNITLYEKGLPSGSRWAIGLNGDTYMGDASAINISLQNGTYDFTALSLSNSSFSSQGGSFTVVGRHTVIPVSFRESFQIYFTETGLPAGKGWSVNLNGLANSSIAPGKISFNLTNGTYNYYILGTPGYHPVSPSGTIEVNGFGLTISVNFVLSTYNVVFTEYGLPASETWYANITAGPDSYNNIKLISSGSSVSVQLPNGSYAFGIASSDKRYEAHGSSFTIQGQNDYMRIYFNPVTYSVAFNENGLPSGVSWNLTINSIRYQVSSDSQIIYETNGTYSFSVSGPAGYHPVDATGKFTVNGGSLSIKIIFRAYTYNITFSEGNLPKDTEWWVNFTSGLSLNSTTDTINSSLSNGTYYFFAGTSNRSWVNTNSYYGYGNYELIVSGHNYTYYLYYTFMTYNVTIFESGLSPGAQWYGFIPGLYGFYGGMGNMIYTSLPNGTYLVNISAWQNGISYLPAFCNITVNGANATYDIVIQRYYTITFTEVGLPSSNYWTWGVNFSGVSYGSSTGYDINLSVPDGKYNLNAENNSMYYANLAANLVNVQGSNITIVVKYEPYAFITLLIQPQNATVLIDGVQEKIQNGYLNVSVLPGNHRVVVYENGYSTYTKNLTLAGGQGRSLQVYLQPNGNNKNSNGIIFGSIGAIVAAFSIGMAFYFIRKKK